MSDDMMTYRSRDPYHNALPSVALSAIMAPNFGPGLRDAVPLS
jgi:hypothetical protein